MSGCEFGKPYSEYVKGTKFERGFDPKSEYGKTTICCHQNAPAVIFQGMSDNYQCKKAIYFHVCPIGRRE